jgi:putative flippase GtrA
MLLAPRARVLRFVCVGGLATLTQLGLLALFTAARWEPVRANAAALSLSSQVNFGLSSLLTWGDAWGERHAAGRWGIWRRPRLVAVRWVRFMGAILCTTLLNEGLYTIVQRLLAPLLGALLCSMGIAALNFIISDRLVFTRPHSIDLNA